MEVIPRGPVPPSRRLINLEMKKLRKLKNELMDKYGKKNEQAIDSMIENARNQFRNDTPYVIVYQDMANRISNPLNNYHSRVGPQRSSLETSLQRKHSVGAEKRMPREASDSPVCISNLMQENLPVRGEENKSCMEGGPTEFIDGGLEVSKTEDNRAPTDTEKKEGGTASHASLFSSPGKRFIPIKPKEKVFDEWAALARHQDEIEELSKKQDHKEYRELQQLYRKELDIQKERCRSSAMTNANQSLIGDKKFVEEQKKRLENEVKKEKDERENKKKLATNLMRVSMDEKRRIEDMKKQQIDHEKSQIMTQIMKGREEEVRIKESENEQKRRMKEILVNSHDHQAQMRKLMRRKEHDLEKQFQVMEANKLAASEQERQKYFSYLKSFDNKGDLKTKHFSRYMKEDINALAKMDEQRYIQKIRNTEEENNERERTDQERKLKEQEFQKKMLGLQVREKRDNRRYLVQEEKQYAEKIKKNVEELEASDKKRQESDVFRRKMYMENLRNQIEENNKKRKFQGIMSEYERMMNLGDLNAYENFESKVHSKVVGVRNPLDNKSGKQHQILSRHFNLQKSPEDKKELPPVQPPPNMQKMGLQTNANNYYMSNNQLAYQKESDEAKVLNAPILLTNRGHDNSSPIFPNYNRIGGGKSSPKQEDIEIAVKNMQDPEMKMLRHDTYNRAYGFKDNPLKPSHSSLAQAAHFHLQGRDITPDPIIRRSGHGGIAAEEEEGHIAVSKSMNLGSHTPISHQIPPIIEKSPEKYHSLLSTGSPPQHLQSVGTGERGETDEQPLKNPKDYLGRKSSQPNLNFQTEGQHRSLDERHYHTPALDQYSHRHALERKSRGANLLNAPKILQANRYAGFSRRKNIGYNIITGNDNPYGNYTRVKNRNPPEFVKDKGEHSYERNKPGGVSKSFIQ